MCINCCVQGFQPLSAWGDRQNELNTSTICAQVRLHCLQRGKVLDRLREFYVRCAHALHSFARRQKLPQHQQGLGVPARQSQFVANLQKENEMLRAQLKRQHKSVREDQTLAHGHDSAKTSATSPRPSSAGVLDTQQVQARAFTHMAGARAVAG